MGMYTEFHFNVELESPPDEVMDVLRHMIGEGDEPDPLPDHPLFQTERWRWLFVMDSAYFPMQTASVLVDEADGEGVVYLSVRANLKNYGDEIDKFVDWIMPHVAWHEFCGFSRLEDSNVVTLYWRGEDGGVLSRQVEPPEGVSMGIRFGFKGYRPPPMSEEQRRRMAEFRRALEKDREFWRNLERKRHAEEFWAMIDKAQGAEAVRYGENEWEWGEHGVALVSTYTNDDAVYSAKEHGAEGWLAAWDAEWRCQQARRGYALLDEAGCDCRIAEDSGWWWDEIQAAREAFDASEPTGLDPRRKVSEAEAKAMVQRICPPDRPWYSLRGDDVE